MQKPTTASPTTGFLINVGPTEGTLNTGGTTTSLRPSRKFVLGELSGALKSRVALHPVVLHQPFGATLSAPTPRVQVMGAGDGNRQMMPNINLSGLLFEFLNI